MVFLKLLTGILKHAKFRSALSGNPKEAKRAESRPLTTAQGRDDSGPVGTKPKEEAENANHS